MSELRIATNPCFDTVVTVRESDKYSKAVYFKMAADVQEVGLRSCVDHYMTPKQLIELGKFLINQANDIEHLQNSRL